MVMDLPDDLELPLTNGALWWYWLGGRPAIDFVNTHRERWWRNVETLVTTADLSLWLTQARLLDEPADPTPGQLRGARRLRAAIDEGIRAAIDRAAPPAAAVSEINRWLMHASLAPRLECTALDHPVLGDAAPSDPVQHALARLALDAATLLGTEQRRRLRVCASTTCSARFYDASRAASRRWCSMSGCGNAAKARRHRARHSGQTASTRPDPPSIQRN
jgi:predicted RNA-binding Zn ribbon-like protein